MQTATVAREAVSFGGKIGERKRLTKLKTQVIASFSPRYNPHRVLERHLTCSGQKTADDDWRQAERTSVDAAAASSSSSGMKKSRTLYPEYFQYSKLKTCLQF